jgi:glycosyltransferase involved in cell wall biosynthesis
LELLKHESSDAGAASEKKHKLQRQLVGAAEMTIAVGPRLHNHARQIVRELQDGVSTDPIPEPVRFDPGFDPELLAFPDLTPPGILEVLVTCRTEHPVQKGLDIASRALGLVSTAMGRNVTLVVRGSGPLESGQVRAQLKEWTGNDRVTVDVFPYSTDPHDLKRDLRRAALVLMPSREEGFGLSGLEAIAAGLPILVSRKSGLAELLEEKLGAAGSSKFIVDSDDSVAWAMTIQTVLADLESAFLNARELKRRLAPVLTWDASIAGLRDEWDSRFGT